MKHILAVLFFFLLLVAVVPVLIVGDDLLIERALNVKRAGFFDSLLIPSFVARVKLSQQGEHGCTLPGSGQTGGKRVINFIVAGYGEPSTDDGYAKRLILDYQAYGCDINEYDATGLTPLHDAILFSQPEMVRFLLEIGADSAVPTRTRRPWDHGLNASGFASIVDDKKGTAESGSVVDMLRGRH